VQPEHEDMVEAEACRRLDRHHRDGARAPDRLGLLLAEARVGEHAEVAGELAGARAGHTALVGAGEIAEAGEVQQPLDNVGVGGEELLTAQAEALDQAVHEEVGARVLKRCGRAALDLQEMRDPLARFGGELG
jgi:hypothetical protein